MQLIYTAHFKKDYKKLSSAIQKKTDEKIKLLVENLSHPSLKRRLQTEISPLPEVVGKNVQEAYLLPY